MGFAGAMAGLGKGMSAYAGTMRENQKMDWAAQQDAAKHERELSLENLRASRSAKEGALNREQQTSINQANIASNEKTAGASIASKEVIARDNIKAQAANTEANIQGQKDLVGVKSDADIKKAEKLLEMEHEETARVLTELQGSELWKNASPARQRIMQATIETGGDLNIQKLMATTGKSEKVTGAILDAATDRLMQTKGFSEYPASVQLAMMGTEAFYLANPTMPRSGNVEIPEDKTAGYAADFIAGKVTGEDLAELSKVSRDAVLESIREQQNDTPSRPLATNEMRKDAEVGRAMMNKETAGVVEPVKKAWSALGGRFKQLKSDYDNK